MAELPVFKQIEHLSSEEIVKKLMSALDEDLERTQVLLQENKPSSSPKP